MFNKVKPTDDHLVEDVEYFATLIDGTKTVVTVRRFGECDEYIKFVDLKDEEPLMDDEIEYLLIEQVARTEKRAAVKKNGRVV